MQAISAALRTILKSHYQAGADGFRGRIELGLPSPPVPDYIGTGGTAYVGGGSPVLVQYPTDGGLPPTPLFQEGDYLLCHTACPGGNSPTAPAGWDTIYTGGATDGAFYQSAAFGKFADAADVAAASALLTNIVAFGFGGGVGGIYRVGTMYAFRGVSTDTQFENVTVLGMTGSRGTVPDVDVTASGAGRLALNLIYSAANSDPPPAYTGESGGTWEVQYATDYTQAHNVNVGLQTARMVAAGTVGGGSYTRNPSSTEHGQTIGVALIGDPAYFSALFGGGGSSGASYRVMRVSTDKSLGTDADRCEVDIDNSDGAIALPDIPPDSPARVFQWYGALGNQVRVFSMLVDRVHAHRHPNMLTVSGRDWMKKLIIQKVHLIAPQDALDPSAPIDPTQPAPVRDATNYVYLNIEVSTIVTDLLDRASFPGSTFRDVATTSVTVTEFRGNDDEPFAAAISRLADLVGYQSQVDEGGVYHFIPNDNSSAGDPDYTYRTGEDILVLDREMDDDQLYTRVEVRGPMTTTATADAWDEVWSTTVITHPVGAWHDPSDSANLRVLDSHTKRIYLLRQSDRVVLGSVYVGGSVVYPLGLSGDPADATIYWVLEAPWAFTGGTVSGLRTGNKLHKFRKSDNVHLASYNLPNGRWSDMKASAAFLWLTDYDTDQLWKFDKSAVTPTTGYSIGGHINPTGVAVNGTDVEVFYEEGHSYVVAESAPSVITNTILSSADMWGGEWDTTTDVDLYVVGSGHVWKYTTATTTETSVTVTAEAVDTVLEGNLLALNGYAEVRRLVVNLPAILSQADAQATAEQLLAQVNHYGDSLDAGIIGNPALQKGDKVRIEDPVLGIASDWQVISYRADMAGDAGTYLGTLSMKPWAT